MLNTRLAGTRLLVFDIDDTLYLEIDYVRSGFRAVAEQAKLNLEVKDFMDKVLELSATPTNRGKVFNLALDSLGVNYCSEDIREMVRIYRNHEPDISLLPDALQVLDSLKGKFQMAALSDGPLESQKNKVQALGLRSWLSPIILTSEYGPEYSKPSRSGFEEIQRKTRFSGNECVYIADNPLKDFDAPAMLKWKTVRIIREKGIYASLESKVDIDLVITNLLEILDG